MTECRIDVEGCRRALLSLLAPRTTFWVHTRGRNPLSVGGEAGGAGLAEHFSLINHRVIPFTDPWDGIALICWMHTHLVCKAALLSKTFWWHIIYLGISTGRSFWMRGCVLHHLLEGGACGASSLGLGVPVSSWTAWHPADLRAPCEHTLMMRMVTMTMVLGNREPLSWERLAPGNWRAGSSPCSALTG